jgi:glycosyltransferase involved in cell wall biosynthesis
VNRVGAAADESGGAPGRRRIRRVALLPWGDVIEDLLAGLGMTFAGFRDESHEGFPVALLEAMACSLPVVATAVPGAGDILAGGEEAGGIVVPPERPDALAAALGRLVDDDAVAHALGERARRRVEREFSLDAVGTRLGDVLNGWQHGARRSRHPLVG